jgi:DNA-directed RNA polymerase subunit RPC12/RpoP
VVSMYTGYKCKTCRFEFILLSEDIGLQPKDRYLSCPFCGSRYIVVENVADDLKEVMRERSYKRKHGAIVQK